MKTKIRILTALVVAISLCLVPTATQAGEPTASVDLQVTILPKIISISVNPTTIDFGDLVEGQDSKVEVITVNNTGTVPVSVMADLVPAIWTVFHYGLSLNGKISKGTSGFWDVVPGLENLLPGSTENVSAQLEVPLDWPDLGPDAITLEFVATAVRQGVQ